MILVTVLIAVVIRRVTGRGSFLKLGCAPRIRNRSDAGVGRLREPTFCALAKKPDCYGSSVKRAKTLALEWAMQHTDAADRGRLDQVEFKSEIIKRFEKIVTNAKGGH
jgi:hypothetical protein